MDYNFTEPVKDVIAFSREEALRLENPYIAPEHFLLALIRQGNNTALQLLEDLNVDLADLKEELETAIADAHIRENTKKDNLPLTKFAENVIRASILESGAMNSPVTDTEHLLLAILKGKEYYATEILEQHGVTYKTCFQQLIHSQVENSKSPPPAPPDGPYDIYISKKTEDYPLAAPIYEFLTKKGLNVFLSEHSIVTAGNSDYMKEIDKALEESSHLIVICSKPGHFTAAYVESEWRTFLNEKRSGRKSGNIISVITPSIKITEVPIGLRNYQIVSLEQDYLNNIYHYVKRK
jgi:Clp amino terminal domain, pathogenicity island component/TIR domain